MTAGRLQLCTLAAALALGLPGKAPAQVPSALQGDWVVVSDRTAGQLHVDASGQAVTLSLPSSDAEPGSSQRFRVAEVLGEALALEPARATPPASKEDAPALPPRARLLPIADTVALFWEPHRRTLLAYRERPVPPELLGRYTIDPGESEVRVIELGATSIALPRDAGDRDEDADVRPFTIPILAVTDSQPRSVRLLLGAGPLCEVLRIELDPGHATLVQECSGEEDQIRQAQFVPTGGPRATRDARSGRGKAPDQTASRSAALPGLVGQFHLSALGQSDEQLLTVANDQWSFRPVGGWEGTVGWTSVSASLAPGAARMQLGRREHGAQFFTLRRLGDDGALLERNQRISVLYREDTPPPWVPLAGLSEDVGLLCRELAAAGEHLDDTAIPAAFLRAGQGARSDGMRALVSAILGLPADHRASALEHDLINAGEPIPACAGVDRLRALPGQRRAPRQADDD